MQLTAKLTGIAALLMHSEQLVDPTNPYTRALRGLTSKRTKTDEIHLAIKRAEWEGSMYLDRDGRPCLPASNVLASLGEGARKAKLGKLVKSGVFALAESFRLEYGGPDNLDQLFETEGFVSYRGVRVTSNKVMRTRPQFPIGWSSTIELEILPEVISADQVVESLTTAGKICGIGDYRPQYGRYVVEVLKVS